MNRREPGAGGGPAAPNLGAPTPPPPPDEWGGQQRLEGLLSQADTVLQQAEFDTANLTHPSTSAEETDGPFGAADSSLKDRLVALFASEVVKKTRSSYLKLASNLLTRLMVTGSPVTRLLLTLKPPQEGYTLGICTDQDVYTEIVKFSYQDNYLLDCVDQEEIPVILIDLLQELSEDLFHDGCIVCQIKDCRTEGGGGDGRGRFVLLRPSTQSVICDSLRLGRETLGRVTSEDRNNIESQILVGSGKPVCLDPSPLVGLIANKANHARLKFNTYPLRRHAHKHYSQAGQARKRKLESLPAPPELKIHDFIKNLNANRLLANSTSTASPVKSARRSTPLESLRAHQERTAALAREAEAVMSGATSPPSCVTGSLHLAAPHLRLAMPNQVDVEKFVRPLSRRPETIDMSPVLVEEYILETAERGQPRVYHTRLTILQRPANEEYIGELYVERDFKDDEKKGSTCRFQLGTRTDALKYINQFTEIFTEEGRKSVEITHKVPGQPPRVTYTPGLKASMAAQAAQQSAAASAAQPSPVSGQPTTPQQPAAGQATPQASILSTRKPVVPMSTHLTINSQGGLNVVKTVPGPPTASSSGATSGPGTPSPGSILQPSPGSSSILQPSPGGGGGSGAGPSQVTPTKSQLNTILASKISRQIVQTPHGPQLIQTLNPVQSKPKVVTAAAAAGLQQQQQQQQQQQVVQKANNNNGDNPEQAISAIVQSLMSDEAQFMQRKQLDDQRKPAPAAAPIASATAAMAGGTGTGPAAAQLLPTVPVPPASLIGQRLPSGRVTLQNLRSLPIQQQPVKVSLSQLAAQLNRPVQTSTAAAASSSLLPPSYSQAIASQVVNPALQITSPQKRDQASPALLSSGGDTATAATPSLQALLSDEKAVTVPTAQPVANQTLLERLMAGNSNSSNSPNLNPLAGQVPSVATPPQANGGNNSGSSESNDITLAALLSNPPKSAVASNSPSKMSPLLQQLQQPVQTVPPRLYASAGGLTSPKHPPSSPRTNATSPRSIQPAQSPRSVLPASPRQSSAASSASSLQQQLMQPPASAPRYSTPVTTHSILSAQLSQPPRSAGGHHQQQALMAVTSQGLVPVSAQQQQLRPQQQQHLVQVSQGQILHVAHTGSGGGGGQVLHVSQAAQQPQQVQLQVAAGHPGNPVQVQLGQPAAGNQVQLSQIGGNTVQLGGQAAGQVQLGGQAVGGQVHLGQANSQQVQLAASHQVQLGGQAGSTVQVQASPGNGAGGGGGGAMVSVSLQDLVNSGTISTGGSGTINGTVAGHTGGIVTLGQVGQVQLVNQSIPVQLSIPGHNQPITFSVSLPEGHGVNGGGTGVNQQQQQMLINSTPKQAGGGVTVSSVGKLLNGPGGSGTVLLQGPGGNIIQLPGAAAGGGQPSNQQQQFTTIKPATIGVQNSMNNMVRTNQLMVRPSQPNSLLVQMQGGTGGASGLNHQQPQSIQIVRSLPVNQQINCGGTLVQAVPSQVKTAAGGGGATPSPQGPPTPQTPGIPPSPVSVTSPPGGLMAPESPMVVQLQNHPGGGQDHHFVLSSPKQGGGGAGGGPPHLNNQTLNSQPHLKIRQQRKQSLK